MGRMNEILPNEKFADQNELRQSVSPLLKCMAAVGLYFRRDDLVTNQDKLDEDVAANGTETHCVRQSTAPLNSGRLTCSMKYYAASLSIVLWCNVLRFLSAFTNDDTFGLLLITKLSVMSSFVLSAILHSAYFKASQSGKLDSILLQIRVTTDFAKRIRRIAVAGLVFISVALPINLLCFYSLLFQSKHFFDFLLAPIGTHISTVRSENELLKWFYLIVVQVLCTTTWLCGHLMNHILMTIFSHQFSFIGTCFRRSIDARGRFHGDLKAIRNRYQALCCAVRMADEFIMISNVASFCCQMFSFVILMYSFVMIGLETSTTAFAYDFFMTGNVVGLITTTAHGIAVNHAVSLTSNASL